MPKGIHKIDLNIPIQKVWEFVSVIDKWAPLVPGYIEHQIINDLESTWTFTSDIGIIKKKISLRVRITDTVPPTKVKFDLIGINESFIGNGYFAAEVIDGEKTRMTGYLNIEAQGVMAKMANGVLKSHVPQMTMELSEAVAERLRKMPV